MKYNKGFGVIAVILIIVGVLIVGSGVYYFSLKIKTNQNDSKYLKSENMISRDNILTKENYDAFTQECISKTDKKPIHFELSSKRTGESCSADMNGCQSSIPRYVEVCGNNYVIGEAPLYDPFLVYGIFKLE